MSADGCLFCRIAQRKLPAQIVAEDPEFLAFNDSNPQAPTHVLVIPRLHLGSLAEALPSQERLLGRALLFTQQLAKTRGLEAGGYRVVTNCGAGAGQSVLHLHFHVLGGRAMRWPPG